MRTARGLDWNRHRAGRTIFRQRRTALWLFQFVDSFDDKKNAKRHDHKIDRDGDEIAVGKNGSQLPSISQRQTRRDFVRQRKVEITEIEIAHESADWRHKQVLDDRADYFPKCSADNNADREVNRVAFNREFLELLPHAAV